MIEDMLKKVLERDVPLRKEYRYDVRLITVDQVQVAVTRRFMPFGRVTYMTIRVAEVPDVDEFVRIVKRTVGNLQ